jgi:hypothetical protein
MAKFRSTPENKDRLESKKQLRRTINFSRIVEILQLCALLYIAFKLS